MPNQSNPFELRRDKSILTILDGDVDFGEIETTDSKGNIKISMPYLSGPVLCGISSRFGLPVTMRVLLRPQYTINSHALHIIPGKTSR
jgi:hypothetical protein